LKPKDKILAWSALTILGLLFIFFIVPVTYHLIANAFRPDIRDHCSEIHSAKFRNLLRWDGFDSIPHEGDIILVDRSTEICNAFSHLNKIDPGISKDSRGYIEFMFYNTQKKYIGKLDLQYKPSAKGYHIHFGASKTYGCSLLSDILFDEVKKKYPPKELQ
jgi:hypothetical protein